LGDEYEHALSAATQEEIIDLAGKLVFLCFIILEKHKIVEQYHLTLL
jgi:hypothetical protein